MSLYRASCCLLFGVLAAVGPIACASQGAPQSLGSDNPSGSGGSVGSSSGSPNGTQSVPGSNATGSDGPGSSSGTATASGGGSGGSTNDLDGGLLPPTPPMGNTCLKAGAPDFSKKGPYTVTKTSVDLASYLSGQASPTTYAIFAPTPLEPNCPHPVVAWGNGTGVTGSSTSMPAGTCAGIAATSLTDCLSGTYDFFNVYAASYGIVVIASDNSNTGSGQYHKAGIDYMMKQNADPMSPFYQKLSTRVGVSGHSQGAMGATIAAGLIGASLEAEVCVAGGGVVTKNNNFLCLTGTADGLESDCKSSVQAAAGAAFLADWDGGDHTTTETLAGYVAGQEGTFQFMHLYAAWFRCFLADDQTACSLFRGGTPSGCGICKNPGWAILQSRNM